MPIPVGLAKLLIRTGIAAHVPSIRELLGDGVAFLKYYSRRILGAPNVDLRAAQVRLNEHVDRAIDLSIGAPACNPRLLGAIQDNGAVMDGYPPVTGMPALRRAIADKLLADNAVHADPDHEILICNGVSQGIGLALDTFVDSGECVVVLDPSFFMYRLAAQYRGTRIVELPTWLEEGRTMFRERDFARLLRGAKLLFLNSPANPTGGMLSSEALERIAWWCDRRDVLIFSDEVYERFVYSGSHVSIGSFPKARRRTVTANGFSKSHGMAGFRVGYLAAARHLIQPMIVSALSTAPFVSMASQQTALRALQSPPREWQAVRDDYFERRAFVAERIRAAGLAVSLPGGAFYYWVPVRQFGWTGDQFAQALFEEERVIVMSGRLCGRSGNSFVRLSYAGERAALEEGLRRIAKFLTGMSPDGGTIRRHEDERQLDTPPYRKTA